jgi:mannose-1-phosphate guanylyltransferase/mannose-6-phosphate isomerase
MKNSIRPIILSGGSGTRLWPVSRESYPKQFCEFFDQSFLANTWNRIKVFGPPMVVTLESMGPLTRKTLEPLGLKKEDLILEPLGKNTAAAVALICHVLSLRGESDAIAAVFPADHIVTKEDVFRRAVEKAVQAASEDFVCTIGVTPRYAATGFGYVETEGGRELEVQKVLSFREKPKLEVAESYVKTGRHFWNSGIFVFKVSTMQSHIRKLMPDAWDRMQKISADLSNLRISYANLEAISLDHAIAEKISSLACVPCEMGWSDVGSWEEISRLSDEATGIRVDSKARVFRVGSESSFVFGQSPKVVGLVDVEDLVVVDTQDALLVTKKGRTEKVRDLVRQMKEAGVGAVDEHVFEYRPWGRFEILRDESTCKVKKIVVDPLQQLSYQSHEQREENWIIVKGSAEVTLDGNLHVLKVGDAIRIPPTAKHRIKNPSPKEDLQFVEVQTGQYFGEDDIKRYADDYHRV